MKVLYVEDNPIDIDLTLRHINIAAPHITIDVVRTQREALIKLKKTDILQYHLVLTDMHLEDGDGIAILSHIRSHSLPVSVVILTGQGDEEAAVASLKAGADDYIVKKKGYLENLPQMLEDAYRSYHEGTERTIQKLNVLYIEHNLADVDLAKRHFEKHAPHISLNPVYRVSEFYQLLEDQDAISGYNVILLDYRLPQENALELLKTIRSSESNRIPVILITGKGDEEIAVKSLKLGAFDYVTKNQGYLFKLPSVIENAFYSVQHFFEHKALLSSERRYRSLFENHHVIMLLIDPETGRIVDANPAAANFYGWSRDELKKKFIFEINVLPPMKSWKKCSIPFIRIIIIIFSNIEARMVQYLM